MMFKGGMRKYGESFGKARGERISVQVESGLHALDQVSTFSVMQASNLMRIEVTKRGSTSVALPLV